MISMSPMMVYVTASSKEEALAIGKNLLKDRLAACANVIPKILSAYWWDGDIQEDEEAVLILKTRRSLIERLTVRVNELHSYDCPCVAAWPLSDGNADYFNWIMKETK